MRSGLYSLALSVATAALIAATGPYSSAEGNPDIFVTPVANAPFSGVVKIERSFVQGNGSLITFKSIREIGRDNQGRIHNESRSLVSSNDNRTPALVRIHLYDPLTRTTAYLNPVQKTFWMNIVGHPPSTEPPDLNASPMASALPQNQFAKQEDLGTQEVDGVAVHGVRETQTVPAEASGTGKEIVVTDEYWYSSELHMNLIRKHSDPRTGSMSLTVTQLTRNEPEPTFFEIPQDYKELRGGQIAGQ